MTYRSPLGVDLSERFVRLAPDRTEVRLVTVPSRRFDWIYSGLIIGLAGVVGLAIGLMQKGDHLLPRF